MSINKALLALALGLTLAATSASCKRSMSETEYTALKQERAVTELTPEQKLALSVPTQSSGRNRWVTERIYVRGRATDVLIDVETGLECVRDAQYSAEVQPWACGMGMGITH